MRTKIVGYYTNDKYKAEAAVLKLSLDGFGYQYDIRKAPDLGSWQKNTQYKAHFIRAMLCELNEPILYLDVDSIVCSHIEFIDGLMCDIAAVHFNNSKELLSGTVYFGNTPKCREVVDLWIELNEKYPDKLPDGREAWDQRTLEIAIKKSKCNFRELPQGYTWITELTPRHMKGVPPMIIHTRGAYKYGNK